MKFHLFHKKVPDYLSDEDKARIVEAIGHAETQTSGEVRVFVEGKCRKKDALTRAKYIFKRLKMQKTEAHNGVLVYVAVTSHKLAVYGDEGIHAKVGNDFWNAAVKKMIENFSSEKGFVNGIVAVVADIGEALRTHFPYDKINDVNELPDDVVVRK